MKTTMIVLCLATISRLAFGIEMLTFSSTSGTYAPGDSFEFDVTLIFGGYNASGLDYWLETTSNLAPFLFITGVSYGTEFTDPMSTPTLPEGFTVLEPNSWFRNQSDLGAVEIDPFNSAPPGAYLVGHIILGLSESAPSGVYQLETSRLSNVADSEFDHNAHFFPRAIYTLTVSGDGQSVPESDPGIVAAVALVALFLIQSTLARKEALPQDRQQQLK